jgi:nitroreductase
MTVTNPVLDAIRNRKHAGALMLTTPGPNAAEMAAMLEAAAAAPDHGKLVPFRFVTVPDETRARFVEASLAAFKSVSPDADEVGLKKARGKAEQPPVLVALIARFQPNHPKIGMPDQWLTVGCALQNLWLAAESLGFACGVSSGRVMESSVMREAFALQADELIASVISIGTPKERQPPRAKPPLSDLVSQFR